MVNSSTAIFTDPARAIRPRPCAEIAAGGVAAAVTAVIAWFAGAGIAAIAWAAAIGVVYAARLVLCLRAADQDEADHGTSLSLQLGLAVTGLLWGVAVAGSLLVFGLAWPTASALAVIAALAVTVLGCYSGHATVVLVFAFVTATPVALTGAFLLRPETIALAIASLAFIAAVAYASRHLAAVAGAYRALLQESTRLQADLKALTQENQRLQVGVKTNSDKRRELEQALHEVNSNLQISEGKADALSSALQRVSPFDNETGLLNAKKYVNVIEREWARMQRQELPITVVHMMIDNFDGYREAYGRVAYESALRRIAELTRKTGTRPGDVVARLEDNKFALLFPEADHKNGETLANVLREQIRRLNIPNMASTMHSAVTASFGVATVIPNSDLTIDDFAARADGALYEAQFQGGDKVVRYRTINNIKLERWDRDLEGDLTPDGLIRKLAVLGYASEPRTLRPGEYQADRRVQIDTIDAIVQGKLKVSLEGESRILHPGDCLFIPKGHVTSIEVVGDKPVICLEGTRA